MEQGSKVFPISFSRHTKRANRRDLGLQNAKKEEERRSLYRDLVVVTGQTLDDSTRFVGRLKNWKIKTLKEELLQPWLIAELERVMGLTVRVIDQTKRRVFKGESVPSDEKLVSIFEVHTDIIKKSRRDICCCMTRQISSPSSHQQIGEQPSRLADTTSRSAMTSDRLE